MIRPDPQAIWPVSGDEPEWAAADAHYYRSSSGGGRWEYMQSLPEQWCVNYGKLSFYVEPTSFKHTGLFPEQAVNWKWIIEKIQADKRSANVLNLFAYTGGATVAAAYAGAEVCHVDASKGMVTRAKENLFLSGLASKPVRFIVDDVVKFVGREKRRGKFYDAIIMGPPLTGGAGNGEMWKIEDELFGLIGLCMDILTPDPMFFLINSYTTGLSPTVIGNMLALSVGKKYSGRITADEVGLPICATRLILPCGAWEDGKANNFYI